MVRLLLWAIAGFLSGSVLYSMIIPKWICHLDVTEIRDHNPGASNAFIAAGRPVGALCLTCDLLKGALPVWLSLRQLAPDDPWFALVLAAPVFGHAFSPMRYFHGGKAIAVSFGVLLGLFPGSAALLVLAGLFLFFSLVVVIRPHRYRVLWSYLLLALWSLAAELPKGLGLGILLICALVLYRHLPKEEGEAKRSVRWFAWRRLSSEEEEKDQKETSI